MYKKYVLVIGLVFLVTACGSGGSGSDGDGDGSKGFFPPNPDATMTISGKWLIVETDAGNDCGETIYATWDATIVQTGSDVQLTNEDGDKFKGVVDGNTLYWVAKFPEDGGITRTKGKVTYTDTDEMTGTSTWAWTDGDSSCSGKTDILATCHGTGCITEH